MRSLFLISGIGMVLVGLFSIIYWQRRNKTDASFYLLGAAAWIAGVALKFAFAIAFNEKMKTLLEATFAKSVADILLYTYIGLLTGVFECGMVLLFLYLIKNLQRQSFEQAVSFGIGFGAVEAIIVGTLSLVSVSVLILFPESVPKDVLNKIDPSKLWTVPAPIIERISAIFIHTFSTVLIVYAFITKKFKWFWASFVYKTLVDTLAAWFALNKYGNAPIELYSIEFEFAILAVFGFVGLKILKDKWPEIYENQEIS